MIQADHLDVHLWQEGHLDRLPHVMGHAFRCKEAALGHGHGRPGRSTAELPQRRLRGQCRRILAAACGADQLAGDPPSGLWSAEDRMTVRTRTMRPCPHSQSPSPAGASRLGGVRFPGPDRRPRRRPPGSIRNRNDWRRSWLAIGPTTLLHGDYWTGTSRRRQAGLSRSTGPWCSGSPAAELVSFLVGCGGRPEPARRRS